MLNRECSDQTAWMCMLICVFAVPIWHKSLFPMLHSKIMALAGFQPYRQNIHYFANSIDPDETAHCTSRLIRICTVCLWLRFLTDIPICNSEHVVYRIYDIAVNKPPFLFNIIVEISFLLLDWKAVWSEKLDQPQWVWNFPSLLISVI